MVGVLEKLLSSEHYLECLHVASMSKGDTTRYGAVLVKDGDIIGAGFNRKICKPVHVDRVIRQGYANHAEVEALNGAIMKFGKGVVEGSEIYVAGYFTEGGHLDVRPKAYFTCRRCPRPLGEYDVQSIWTPTPNGWAETIVDQAMDLAKDFGVKHDESIHARRLEIGKSRYTVDHIAGLISAQEHIRKFLPPQN